MSVAIAFAQANADPNSYPNPYQTIDAWAKLPDGRTWGAVSAVDIDKDGTSVWVAERCGATGARDRTHSCFDGKVDPILKFDRSGQLVKSFGAGMMGAPHGLYVDHDGNIWVTDYQDNSPPATTSDTAAGSGLTATSGPPLGATKGHQVFKFSPEGELLLTLGKPGGGAAPDFFYLPCAIVVAQNGDVFVADGGHANAGGNARILKFDKTGRFIKAIGQPGSQEGQFDQPHSLAMDSRGRLFVADRSNGRIQILDQDGRFIAAWKQFGRPSAVYIDKNDVLYVGDNVSTPTNNPGFNTGIRIGSAKDGVVQYFIPAPSDPDAVAVDRNGVIYGAEVNTRTVRKHVKPS